MTASSRPTMRRRQLLGLADSAMALRAVAGANIAAMVTHGALDVATAIALVDAAVPATLDADIALVVLAHMSAAGDAALQSAVLDEINALIAGGDITLTNAIATLQALLPGASTALQAVVDEALAILLTDPATLAETAGLGSPAQVQAAVNAIVLLFSTDPTAAQGILDALSGRIESGDLGSDQAATLLAKIYARGGDAADAALDTIVDLTTSLDIPASTMANAIATQVDGRDARCHDGLRGLRCAVAARFARSTRRSRGSSPAAASRSARSTPPSMPASTAHRTPSRCWAASCPVPRPACAPKRWRKSRRSSVRTPRWPRQALPTFIQLAVSGDHGAAARRPGGHRSAGRGRARRGQRRVPGAAVLPARSRHGLPDADPLATLSALLAGGYLTTAEAIQHIDDQLSPGNPSPLINAFQAVNILVALSAVDGARTAIYDYIRQEIAANSAAQAAGPSHPMWPFTAQPVIAALAKGTVADLDHVEQTALDDRQHQRHPHHQPGRDERRAGEHRPHRRGRGLHQPHRRDDGVRLVPRRAHRRPAAVRADRQPRRHQLAGRQHGRTTCSCRMRPSCCSPSTPAAPRRRRWPSWPTSGRQRLLLHLRPP